MALGCLSGNGRQTPIDATYRYCGRGVESALFPDVMQENVVHEGTVRFSEGALTDGDPQTIVGWKAETIFETGLDIVIDLGAPTFVDHVVLHEDAASGQAGVDGSAHLAASGISSLEVYAIIDEAQPPRLVARMGESGPDLLVGVRLALDVGVATHELVIRLIPFEHDIVLSGLEIWGASLNEPRVFPVPAKMALRTTESGFELSDEVQVVIGDHASDETRFAAALLVDKIGAAHGIDAPVVRVTEQTPGAPVLILGKPGECALLAAEDLPVPTQSEGYTVKVTDETVQLLGYDRRGLVYAVETWLQLLQQEERRGVAAACLIEDHPRLPVRGVHLYVPAREEIPFFKRLIRHLLVPMKINTVFWELAGAMRFDRRPEIADTWEQNNRRAAEGKGPRVPHGKVGGGGTLTKQEVKGLLDDMRSYGLEVIPEIQSLSHAEYLTMTYPEIAEQHVEDGYPDSYCPLHPMSREIVFDLIDEVLELFGPLPYVHMGHDEVYTMAVCERCRGKSRAELYAHDVNEIYDYLKGKGVGMMLWADMLQPFRPYAGPEAIDAIPKDIVLLEFVWYFRTEQDTEDRLLENGFTVILGNYYSSHFPRFESRSGKPGVIGAEVSAWTEVDEAHFGRRGKFYDFIYSANTMWSRFCQDELRWTFDKKVSALMPAIRGGIRDAKRHRRTYRPLDLAPHQTAPIRDETGRRGKYDLSTMPHGTATLEGIPFQTGPGIVLVEGPDVRHARYPANVTIPIVDKLEGLVFLHTCTAPGIMRESNDVRPPLARYEIQYADGATESIDIAYGDQLAEWDRRHAAPLPHMRHRHYGYVGTYPADPLWQGKSPRGEDVTLYGWTWTNLHPEREIRSLVISAEESETDTALIVAGVTGVHST